MTPVKTLLRSHIQGTNSLQRVELSWGAFSNKFWNHEPFISEGSKGSLLCQPKTCTIREIPQKLNHTFASSLIPLPKWAPFNDPLFETMSPWFLRVFNIVQSGLSEFFLTPPFPFKTVASSISSVEMFSVSGSCFFVSRCLLWNWTATKTPFTSHYIGRFNRDHLFLHQLWFFQGFLTPLVEGKHMLTPNWPGWMFQPPPKSPPKNVFSWRSTHWMPCDIWKTRRCKRRNRGNTSQVHRDVTTWANLATIP